VFVAVGTRREGQAPTTFVGLTAVFRCCNWPSRASTHRRRIR
jgi:hypothetical protein